MNAANATSDAILRRQYLRRRIRTTDVLGEKYPGGLCFLIDPEHSTCHSSLQTKIGSETWVSNGQTSIGDLLLSAVCQR
ncbi:hypothetical protein CGLO_12796 [Colletotrichum gloeosporioides Cg-14]|uniref:Uncharacterized protein n=1 Tax=Colletotrichum gloeosporioides (strain Cg-14) TaxID=1237896 RepID=T0JXU5_COLGC|nr:hypothetical protein CGLO_12796 [Colletotrichum gloeosporioides Cg-14]